MICISKKIPLTNESICYMENKGFYVHISVLGFFLSGGYTGNVTVL